MNGKTRGNTSQQTKTPDTAAMPSGQEPAHSWRHSITSIILNNGQTHSRTASVETGSQQASEPELDAATSPYDSTTALVLEPDDPSLFLSFDEDENGSTSLVSSPINVSVSLPAGLASLPPYVLQLFLIAPSLLLGATLLQNSINVPGSGFSRIYLVIIWTVAAAFLQCLASQIWVLSGSYVRKWRSVHLYQLIAFPSRLITATNVLFQHRRGDCTCVSRRLCQA